MLGEIRHRLERTLREERHCPVRVEYGPVSPDRIGEARDVIVVEYDRNAGDTFGPPRTMGKKGVGTERRFTRSVGCKATIYARATVAGARRQDHEDRAFSIGTQLLIALDDVLRGGRVDDAGAQIANTQHAWDRGTGQFTDQPGETTHAVYELPFVIHTGVHDAVFGGDTPPGFTLGDNVANRTNVYGSNGEGAGETSCGG
jgi:hypothetical protein